MKKVAINGLGRIGRATLKIIMDNPEIELVAVNDIASLENVAYLLKYDSVNGKYDKTINVGQDYLLVDDKKIPFFSERNPENLPWQNLGVEVVVESTGAYTSEEDAGRHLQAGAKTVVISGPSKDHSIPTVVHGVNTKDGHTNIFSCASCTTNNISPVIEILGRRIGISKAIMTTVHAGTASNSVVDSPGGSNFRMGRTAMTNLIPTTTGAAKAMIKAMPEYNGKFDGMAIRVPVAIGSVSDITMMMDRKTSVREINSILTEEAATTRY